MPSQGIHMPSGYGGLMRYNEEYEGKFNLSPAQIVIFIILIIAFVAVLKIFWGVG